MNQETKQERRRRLWLARLARWAHVKKRGPARVSFRRFWRQSPYRNPPPKLAHLSRQERRRAAYDVWKSMQRRRAREGDE